MDKTAQTAVCYLSCSRSTPLGGYRKRRMLRQMRTLLSALGISMRAVYIDAGFAPEAADRPGLKTILDRLPDRTFDVFVTGSIYDLGAGFVDCAATLLTLAQHHIRIICLENQMDSAIDASFPAGLAGSSWPLFCTDAADAPFPVSTRRYPMSDFKYCKLEIFLPASHLECLQRALQAVDAGHIGRYDCCLSYSEVTGCWRPLDGTTPYCGTVGELSTKPELKVEVTCLTKNVGRTVEAVKKVHPYEEPVINVIPLYCTSFSAPAPESD